MSIKILIADDQRLFRQSLKYLLEKEEEIRVVGEAADGQDAFTLALERHPDIVLMDVDMPKLDGISATRLILDVAPHIKVLMLSVHDEDERIISAIRNGAAGYILKDAEHREFIRIIKGTFRGEDMVSPFLANRIQRVPSMAESSSPLPEKEHEHDKMELLTEQEGKILLHLAEGKSNKEIADMMCVSIETIKSHLQAIYKKLGVKSRTEAAIYFLKEKGTPQ